jgi:hypothetical protein
MIPGNEIKVGQQVSLYYVDSYRCPLWVLEIDQSNEKDDRPCFRACNNRLYYSDYPHRDVSNESFQCETKLLGVGQYVGAS